MTALQIANLALLKLKAQTLTSFNDSGYVADLVRAYLVFVSEQIALEHNWQFARKRAELTENTTTTNNTEYDYVYDLPADFLYPRELHSDDKYIIENWMMYTNAQDPLLIYTSKIMEMADVDGDGATPDIPRIITGITLPALIEDAIAGMLAVELAPKITESLELQGQLYQMAGASLLRAKQHDAMLQADIEDHAEWWGDV
ncbi:MAG: hypothetical protein K9L68_13840 [Spirochaetales bacterium]|nr:hypothetical protein [Spirochaetales bacterium]